MNAIGQTALISLVSHIVFMYLAWKLITCINFEPLIRKGREKEAQILILFVAIVIGTGVSHFFLEVLQWSKDLVYLF